MKKASSTRDTSRGARIVKLEQGLVQLWSQVTALQTRVGALEMAKVSPSLNGDGEPGDARQATRGLTT